MPIVIDRRLLAAKSFLRSLSLLLVESVVNLAVLSSFVVAAFSALLIQQILSNCLCPVLPQRTGDQTGKLGVIVAWTSLVLAPSVHTAFIGQAWGSRWRQVIHQALLTGLLQLVAYDLYLLYLLKFVVRHVNLRGFDRSLLLWRSF